MFITTPQCDLTWLQLLLRPSAQYLCRSKRLTLTLTLWKNSLHSSLRNSQLSWSDESRASSQVKSCYHLPHHLRNIRQQQEADFLLWPLHPWWGSLWACFAQCTGVPGTLTKPDQIVHLLKQHLATDIFGLTWLFICSWAYFLKQTFFFFKKKIISNVEGRGSFLSWCRIFIFAIRGLHHQELRIRTVNESMV